MNERMTPPDVDRCVRGVMHGRMLEGDSEADTITFRMEPGYYLAGGLYEIRPVPAPPSPAKEG